MSADCNPDYRGGMLCRRNHPGDSACTSFGGKAKCLMLCTNHIGQRVTVSPNFKYAADWPGEYLITGIRWEYQRGESVNIAIASDDEITRRYGDTDGFRPIDLVPVVLK